VSQVQTRRAVVAAIAFAMLAATGCAAARNYTDPLGPVIERQAAPATLDSVRPVSPDVRVVTFNIKFGEHVEEAAALLARDGQMRNTDVLVLEEMDAAGAERLARAFLMNHVYIPSAVHPSSGRDFGVAILSPWPMSGAHKVTLPYQHRFRKMRRAAAAVTLHGPLGDVRVYGVHFETPWGLSGRHRRDQAKAVLTDAADWPGPIIIAGDFNGTGPAEEIAKAGFSWLTRNVHNTINLLDADHVLARGFCQAGTVPAGKMDTVRGVSDHVPVWSAVRYCQSPLSSPST